MLQPSPHILKSIGANLFPSSQGFSLNTPVIVACDSNFNFNEEWVTILKFLTTHCDNCYEGERAELNGGGCSKNSGHLAWWET